MTTLHLCIATGQNAANFIPLKQLQAQDIWVLETPEMQKQRSGKDLETALKAALPQALVRIANTHPKAELFPCLKAAMSRKHSPAASPPI